MSQRIDHRSPFRGIPFAACLLAAACAAQASPAVAADGSCLADYAAVFPSAEGHAYINDLGQKTAVPLRVIDGFNSGPAKVFEVPAGQDPFGYYLHTVPGWHVSGGAPHYSAKLTDIDYTTRPLLAANPWWMKNIYLNGTLIYDFYGSVIPSDTMPFARRLLVDVPLPPGKAGGYDANFNPDVNVPDSRLVEMATENTARLTEATKQRLGQYVSDGAPRHSHLDLKAPVSFSKYIKHIYYIRWDRWERDYFVDEWSTVPIVCSSFVEIVKHPRIQGLVFLKSYLATTRGLKPHDMDSSVLGGKQMVNYAPVFATPSYMAPKLQPDHVETDLVTPVTVDVLANDTKGTGQLTLTSATQPAVGSVQVSNGRIVFTPVKSASQVGSFTIVYTASDGKDSFQSTLTITVTNRLPGLVDDDARTFHRHPVSLNVLRNDSDTDGPEALRVVSVSDPVSGSVSWSQDGTLVYTPVPGYIGDVVMTYRATDSLAVGSATIRITTEVCYEDVWQEASLECSSPETPNGSADFSGQCSYTPAGYQRQEVECR